MLNFEKIGRRFGKQQKNIDKQSAKRIYELYFMPTDLQRYFYRKGEQADTSERVGIFRVGEAPYALTLQKAKKLLSVMFSFFNKSYLHQFQNVKAHRLYIR